MKIELVELNALLELINLKGLEINDAIKILADFVPKNQEVEDLENFQFEIDYSKSFDQMIADAHYSWFNSNINSRNFYFKKIEKKDICIAKIFSVENGEDQEAFLERISEQNYREADLFELMTLVIKKPYLIKERKIFALGSPWIDSHGSKLIPFASCDKKGRRLHLRCSILKNLPENSFFLGILKT